MRIKKIIKTLPLARTLFLSEIESKIREIPDWPRKGVSFKDITPLLQDKNLFCKTIDLLISPYLKKKVDKIVGIDARGFILAAASAYKLKTGLAIVRKKGKLPSKTVPAHIRLNMPVIPWKCTKILFCQARGW
jgi:adenine phosphoribosyltransferase